MGASSSDAFFSIAAFFLGAFFLARLLVTLRGPQSVEVCSDEILRCLQVLLRRWHWRAALPATREGSGRKIARRRAGAEPSWGGPRCLAAGAACCVASRRVGALRVQGRVCSLRRRACRGFGADPERVRGPPPLHALLLVVRVLLGLERARCVGGVHQLERSTRPLHRGAGAPLQRAHGRDEGLRRTSAVPGAALEDAPPPPLSRPPPRCPCPSGPRTGLLRGGGV